MNERIIEALKGLDVSNDNHWTADGQPRMETIEALVGENVTRQAVQEAAPAFTRTNPTFDAPNVNPWADVEDGSDPVEFTGTGKQATDETVSPEVVETEGYVEEQSVATDEDAAVEQEYNEALAAKHVADKRFEEARRLMDILTARRERENSGEDHASTVQAYQKAQQLQRQQEVSGLNMLINSLPPGAKELLTQQ